MINEEKVTEFRRELKNKHIDLDSFCKLVNMWHDLTIAERGKVIREDRSKNSRYTEPQRL